MTQTENRLAVLLRARYPYIYIDTYEEMRVVDSILRINREYAWPAADGERHLDRLIYTWSLTDGMRCLNADKKELPGHSAGGAPGADALRALEYISKDKENAVYILKDFHVFMQDRRFAAETVRKLRDLMQQLRTSMYAKNVIFVSPVLSIPEEMQKEITVFDFPLPAEDEILEIFRAVIRENQIRCDVTAEDLREIARSALGMTALEAENAFCRAIVQQGSVSMEILSTIYEEKKQSIRKNGLLEYVDSSLSVADVGGLDVLKQWLSKRRNSWCQDAAQYRLPAPKGVLITGVPGCGKSLVAKTMSASWGLPLIQLDMGRIYSGLVGSSEENMRRAIQTAESMAPCVLWVDEIEKGLAGTGTSNDGGTSTRVFGTLLTWMQEKTATVFILATANDISALKPELLRKGRFDEIFFVDLPTKMEREEIFRLHIEKRMCDALSGLSRDSRFYSQLADWTEGFVGAELEAIVVSALFEAYAEKRRVTLDDFRHAVDDTVPLSKTQSEQILMLREWAKNRAVSATSANYRRDGEQSQSAGRILHL